MTESVYIVARTLLMLLSLLFITRILGRRTLSELTFYDFVIGLVIGNIATAVITETEFSILNGIISLAVATIWILVVSMLTLNSVPARKLIEAEPIMVIHNGKILEDNLKKRYYNVNDLLEMLREQGTFDPQQVEVGLIEPDGQLSILKKQAYQNPTFQDLRLPAQPPNPAGALTGKELIINGKIIEQNLAQSGLTITELQNQLISTGVTDLADVTLAMVTPDGKLYIDHKQDNEPR